MLRSDLRAIINDTECFPVGVSHDPYLDLEDPTIYRLRNESCAVISTKGNTEQCRRALMAVERIDFQSRLTTAIIERGITEQGKYSIVDPILYSGLCPTDRELAHCSLDYRLRGVAFHHNGIRFHVDAKHIYIKFD